MLQGEYGLYLIALKVGQGRIQAKIPARDVQCL